MPYVESNRDGVKQKEDRTKSRSSIIMCSSDLDEFVLAGAEADLFCVVEAAAPVGVGGDVGEVVVMRVLSLTKQAVRDRGLGVDRVDTGLVERHRVEARKHADVRDYRGVVLGVAVSRAFPLRQWCGK